MSTPKLGLLDSSEVGNGDPDHSPDLVVSGDEVDHAVTAAEAEHDDDDDGEEDGFKTPTSAEHMIPVLTECPPAPPPKRLEKLTRHRGRKRRGPSTSSRSEEDEPGGQVEVVDMPSEKVESLFQLRSRDDAAAEQGNGTMKRARIHDRDGNSCS